MSLKPYHNDMTVCQVRNLFSLSLSRPLYGGAGSCCLYQDCCFQCFHSVFHQGKTVCRCSSDYTLLTPLQETGKTDTRGSHRTIAEVVWLPPGNHVTGLDTKRSNQKWYEPLMSTVHPSIIRKSACKGIRRAFKRRVESFANIKRLKWQAVETC